MADSGEDSNGVEFGSIDEMWKEQLKEGHDKWYSKATEYWEKQEVSVNGVLGGYGDTSSADIRESRRLLDMFRNTPIGKQNQFESALDCGAGIGRVSRGVLIPTFKFVDLMEPNLKMLEEAKRTMTLRETYSTPLQDFTPKGPYDCIWNQWCLLYLTDDHLVEYLQRCRAALRENGVIVVKENVSLNEESGFVLDKEDNSITRLDTQYKAIFKRAGLRIIQDLQQSIWPQHLFPVKMYMLH
eukprot:GEMP01050924.1.p1 GENE.GEMP01050924.1~~GEMP01050924.1.p1  ORF type:complete len:241 (+),score=32.77 GEMP01050924.1:50-772(+)